MVLTSCTSFPPYYLGPMPGKPFCALRCRPLCFSPLLGDGPFKDKLRIFSLYRCLYRTPRNPELKLRRHTCWASSPSRVSPNNLQEIFFSHLPYIPTRLFSYICPSEEADAAPKTLFLLRVHSPRLDPRQFFRSREGPHFFHR